MTFKSKIMIYCFFSGEGNFIVNVNGIKLEPSFVYSYRIVFKLCPHLKKKPYWGNHFWAKGYCVDTVGVDAEMIRKYVQHQERLERNLEIDFD